MRADRLLSIMVLLQVHRRLTARELAQRLEVSARTIHRDMEALCAAGIPLSAERGSGGGWSLPSAYHAAFTRLTAAEIQALFLTGPAQVLNDLGLGQAAEEAQLKLLAALPAIYRQDAHYVRQRLYIDMSGWRQFEEAVPWLPTLQEAIWQDRRLRLTYQRGDGASFERLVDPLGLVAKGRVWYMVAAVEGELRTYRVSRVQQAQLTPEASTRPPDFDLAAYWVQSVADLQRDIPRFTAALRAAPDALPHIRAAWRYARIEQLGSPDAGGWLPLTVTFEGYEIACEYVLSMGAQVLVLDPPELREQIARMAAEVVGLYQC
jgi:predicted DNA-binding transcriptional regulator YafY